MSRMTDQQLLEIAATLIERVEVGCLCTISPQGQPFARYAGAVTANGKLNWIYSLASHQTRKIEHITANPAVCWLFGDDNYEHVATLRGRASVKSTTDLPVDTWNSLIDHAHPYAMDVTSDPQHHQFDAIVTRIEQVEVLAPGQGVYHPHTIELS